jgi:hypothetical protein
MIEQKNNWMSMNLFMRISVLLFWSFLCFLHYAGSDVVPSHYEGVAKFVFFPIFLFSLLFFFFF